MQLVFAAQDNAFLGIAAFRLPLLKLLRLKGRVVKSTGKFCEVLTETGEQVSCAVKGKFRMAGLRTTNPLAVGDLVEFDMTDESLGVIHTIYERKNYIIRKSVNLSHEAHIVACNLDRAYLVVTLVDPMTTTGFIDRFLVTADAYGVPVTLVFNKIDTYDDDANDELEYREMLYNYCGYEVLKVSALTGEGIDDLAGRMVDSINLVSGHSGVGKSTLINRLIPGLDLRTAEVSRAHKKGQHTTTFAEMHRLSDGGFIIDTPGIKGFGLIDIPKDELHHHFPEMFAMLPECKFHNCLHINEPGCSVRLALEEERFPEERYRNYLSMYNEDGGAYRL